MCQRRVRMQDAVAAAVGQPGVQQLQAMLEEFLVDVEASLANGTLQAVEACPAGNLDMQEQQALLAHLRLERDVLLSRLERFEQVQAQDDMLILFSPCVSIAHQCHLGEKLAIVGGWAQQ